MVSFTVVGPGRNLAHGNGDHNCHDPEQGPNRRVFHGLAKLIVQSNIGSGPLRVRAESAGLQSAEITLDVQAVALRPVLVAAEPRFEISKWRVSPAQMEKPNPRVVMSEADMNSWMATTVGNLQSVANKNWVLYRATFKPWKGISERGGKVIFENVYGQAEFWVDGVRVGEKPGGAPASFTLDLSAKSGTREITTLVQATDLGKVGFNGSVYVISK
jgi:beta-galactosidase